MKVGIIGLPGTGKTTVYNALTRSNVEIGRFGAAETHVGVIPVPDERFDYAVQKCSPKKVSPATIEVTEGGARLERTERSQSDKFGADFFSAVRNADALLLVTADFSEYAGLTDALNPLAQIEKVIEELLLADLQVVETRIERLDKSIGQKRSSPAEAVERQILGRIREHLEQLKPVRTIELTEDERRNLRGYAFVSAKPIIIAVNVNEGRTYGDAGSEPLRAYADEHGIPYAAICARIEAEVAQMEPAEEREFLEAMGISESARARIIRLAYDALGIFSFFTVGEDEVRAWTVPLGVNAVGAAEKIHSDLARGFIRAEVISFEEFRAVGGCWDEARAAGKMRLEGKEYILKDGDIMHVRFKV